VSKIENDLKDADSYCMFSLYYQGLVKSRGHFENQADIVRTLAHRFSSKEVRILDAACGTGDVLALLANEFLSISGLDGSPEMLKYALSNKLLEGVPLTCCRWNNLDSFFSRTGKYDLIYLLGNSIAHTENLSSFIEILGSILVNGLSKNGVLAFDMRDWVWDQEKRHLIQPNRPIGVEKTLESITVDRSEIAVTETCTYDPERQYVKYKIIREDRAVECTLSYLMMDVQAAKKFIYQIGFSSVDMPSSIKPKYPIIIARKA